MNSINDIRGWLYRIIASLILCFNLWLLLQPQVMANNEPSPKPLKVGFVLVGPASDWSWNYRHDQGRRYMETKLGGKVTTIMAENIPESAEAERIMEKMVAQGCRLIFATSYGYLESVLHVAARHPDVKFMQVHRDALRNNLGTYFYYTYPAMYVSGVVAGHMTKTNKIGYIAGRPIPDVLQNINAFALGLRSIKPDATIKVVWMNTWFDPPLEAEAARGLIETGVDVLGHDPGSAPTVARVAERQKIYMVSGYSDVHQFAPQYWLTGALVDWGSFYTKITQSVLSNTWQSGISICDVQDGTVKLSSFGPIVPSAVRDEANNIMYRIKQGKLIIFKGPVKDSNGKLRLAPGKKPDLDWLGKMNFFVPGVEGNLPKNH